MSEQPEFDVPAGIERINTLKFSTIQWWHSVHVGDRIQVRAGAWLWRVSFKTAQKMVVETMAPQSYSEKEFFYSDAHALNFLAAINGALPGQVSLALAKRLKEVQPKPYKVDLYKVVLNPERRPWLPGERERVFEDDGWTCVGCGWTPGYGVLRGSSYATRFLTVDHIRPLKKGGTYERSNLQTLCAACNSHKSDKYPFDLQADPVTQRRTWL